MGEQLSDKPEPKINVAYLAAYNSGYLHGEWIDADQDAWSIYDDAEKMLAESPGADAEEWAIHDFEGFEGIRSRNMNGCRDGKGFMLCLNALPLNGRVVMRIADSKDEKKGRD